MDTDVKPTSLKLTDPQIKNTVLIGTLTMLATVNKSDNYAFIQYVRNTLNITETIDEIYYVTPKFIFNKYLANYISAISFIKPSLEFIAKFEDIKERYPEQVKFHTKLIVMYSLVKN